MRRKIVALGQSVQHQAKVYLDVNFWLMLRDVDLGTRPDAMCRELLANLRSLASRRIAFCPISESVYFEVLKQSDERTRLATAKLMDELSQGIAITAMDLRTGTELAYALHTIKGTDKSSLDPLDTLVWTRVGHVIGMAPKVSLGMELSVEDRSLLMKAMFDDMWSLSVHELMTLTGKWNLPAPAGFDDLIQYINAGNAFHAEALRSFQQAYNAELQGAVDFCARLQPRLTYEIAVAIGGRAAEAGIDAFDRTAAWRAAFAREMRRDEIRRVLAMVHIQACIHASVRWDKRRQVEANDIFDFNHASDALPYCNAFFTERSLHSTLAAAHVGLDRLYGCKVCSHVSDAIAYLKTLN
jgi:hypothetical protein